MRPLACLIALLLFAAPAAAQERKAVDLALALAIDISGSIDPEEAQLQRKGYVQAFRDPAIVKAILGGPNGRIAVSYFEWSDSWLQKLLIDWALLDSEQAIAALAARIGMPVPAELRTLYQSFGSFEVIPDDTMGRMEVCRIKYLWI